LTRIFARTIAPTIERILKRVPTAVRIGLAIALVGVGCWMLYRALSKI
jgi:hypothetical protein